MVVIAIMATMAVMVLPAWGDYRTRQDANMAAQTLAGELKRLSIEALKGETYTYVAVGADASGTFKGNGVYSLWQYSYTPGGVLNSSATCIKVVNLKDEYGRAFFSVGTGIKRICFGPKGWVATTDDVVDPPSGAETNITAKTESGTYRYYPLVVKCGLDAGTFSIRVYSDGRVAVKDGTQATSDET